MSNKPTRNFFALFAMFLILGAGTLASLDANARPKPDRTTTKPLLHVINYPYQITGKAKTKIHLTLFHTNMQPAAGATVTVDKKKVGETDKHGTLIFDFVPGSGKAHTLKATLKKGNITYSTTKTFTSNARTASFRSDNLFVYTDRGVYKPGDSIQVRLLAWELLADYKAIPDADIDLLLQTPDGRILNGLKVKTGAFGTAHATLPLPTEMPEGRYELVVLYKKARESARIRVETYQPPVMKVEHTIPRFYTPSQKSMEVDVSVSYFAGGEPEESSLHLQVKRQDKSILFQKAIEPKKTNHFFFTLSKSDLDTISKGTQNGETLYFELKATDSFGRTSSVKREVVYSNQPYRAVLEKDKDNYPKGETVKLQAKVVDLDGKPARNLEVQCTIPEFKVKATAKTDDKGVATFSFPMGNRGVSATLKTLKTGTTLGSTYLALVVSKPMTSKVSQPATKIGQKTHIEIAFDPNYVPVEEVVHVDFTDISGALVVSDTIPVIKNRSGYIASGTVVTSQWGTMLANLYVAAAPLKATQGRARLSYKNVGFITEGQHVTVYPGSTTSLSIKGWKPTVKPGETVDIDIQVEVQDNGEASIGASLVDAAVISLLDPLEVTPSDYFYNPQRKVIATGGAAVLSWPVVDRNWGSPWRDIAYTNWGYKGPGALVNNGRSGAAGGGGDGFGAVGNGSGGGGSSGSGYGGGIGVAKGKGMLKYKESAKQSAKASPSKKKVQYEFSDMQIEGELLKPEAEAVDDGEPAPDAARLTRSNAPGNSQEAPRITIRTNFTDTALWEPEITTKGGKSSLRIRFPDAITNQTLTLVASDKKGGVTLVRKDVEVRADLFVQANWPATLRVNDELSIPVVARNYTKEGMSMTLDLQGEGVEIDAPDTVTFDVEPGGGAVAFFTVRPTVVGTLTTQVSVKAPGFGDIEIRRIHVKPTGSATTSSLKGSASQGNPFQERIEFSSKAQKNAATLQILLPGVVPAFQAWESVQDYPLWWIGVFGVSGQALMDTAMFEWTATFQPTDERLNALRQRLARAAAQLVLAQQKNGGWGWWYMADASHKGGYETSLYHTIQALRALVEIRGTDVRVANLPLQLARQYLLDNRNKGGLWSPGDAYFWETVAPQTDWALSAEVFQLLVATEQALSMNHSNEILEIRKALKGHAAENPQDPMFLAFYVKGLLEWDAPGADSEARKEADARLNDLIEMKRKGYWEPHWYHAYGGTIELNAVILELLASRDPNKYAGIIREAVTYLLSTREAMGAWHNETGTVNAVRALLRAGAGAKPFDAGTIQVRVDSKAVASAKLDPADPLLSTASLRNFDLTPYLSYGNHVVTVSFSGEQALPVEIVLSTWKDETAFPHPTNTRDEVTVVRSGGLKLKPYGILLTKLDVTAPEGLEKVQIEEPIPANTSVDAAFLNKKISDGSLLYWGMENGVLVMMVHPENGKSRLSYQLIGDLVGTCAQPPTTVRAPYRTDVRVGTGTPRLIEVSR